MTESGWKSCTDPWAMMLFPGWVLSTPAKQVRRKSKCQQPRQERATNLAHRKRLACGSSTAHFHRGREATEQEQRRKKQAAITQSSRPSVGPASRCQVRPLLGAQDEIVTAVTPLR